jgi:thiol-disulfide isomerase/thioredoxin
MLLGRCKMDMKRWIPLFCMLLVLGCERTETSGKLGDAAWPLTGLTWIKGEPVAIAPGTVYVIEFWATWCPPCRVSIPHLTELQHKYKDRNLVVIGISQEETGVVKRFVEQRGSEMDYAVAVDSKGVVSSAYMDAFGRNGIPSAFVVDADSRIAWVGHPMGGMDAVLERLLTRSPDAQDG